VLALAVVSLAGCRAMDPYQGYGCGEPCGGCCDSCGGCGEPCDGCCESCGGCGESCHSSCAGEACGPGGAECGGTCGRGGNLCDSCCGGGRGCCFDRYCGSECGPGYHPGPYDCSACDSPNWGVNGYRHPHGYVDGRGCLCGGRMPGHCKAPGPHCPCCGHGYCCACCGPPAPGCPVCCCGASGDHHYNFQPGPPVAQTAYPYYTLRGPRDFLLDNPPSIGPY
jgi:hypothetical protein